MGASAYQFKPVQAGWEASGIARFFNGNLVPRFSELFFALKLENVDASWVMKDGQSLLEVTLTGIDPQCALGIPDTPDRASLWADVTDDVNEVRVKLREFSQGTSENDPLPHTTWSESEIPHNPTALRLVLHGGCL
ncbi:hypothetical protein SAMN05445850_1570 [Paraburkholderia tuberum]|uniref:Uncharacterized protein n=2 Tax=Paraburkholderia tuberum TaxID=157910 RepID=A0A1H1D9S6_9BURK|nr:hypothetical protein SAMN05445850_1570 [Paraburkholderia tuberum]